MPYKNLSAPRKVASMNAEIRGAAMLITPSIVAMVSTDPVKLAIHPASGTAKVHNVSLRSADDVAFLTKDAAIVRSGDEVWALIDLAHTPKMEQVGRDTKLLSGHPGGEDVLGLGWDGTATLYKLNKRDVVRRQFVLRGDVRALEVGAADTFVVVEVGEGGELRVHPGPTPEPGARDRATLPRGAAKLDRLRGGRELSIVYKRGGREACVVVRAGGKLSAKMISLRDAALDAVVMESSLFVSFADGTLELYDAGAIAAASDDAVVATHTQPLGASGEARALHAVGRGTLWAGTSAGEVLTLTAVRKTPA